MTTLTTAGLIPLAVGFGGKGSTQSTYGYSCCRRFIFCVSSCFNFCAIYISCSKGMRNSSNKELLVPIEDQPAAD
ncbi:MAG: hypothetical protein LBT18_01445 [Endomicrobium sp.]|nr:hypothetical protein [Endomicrobium sp.]